MTSLIVLIACNKNTGPPPDFIPLKAVYAGEYDESYIYYKYQKPLEIQIKWDHQNLYGFGADSLDIDLDGIFDINVYLNLLNYDSIHLIQGMPNPFPSCWLQAKKGTAIATYSISYPIGLGQTASATYVDTLQQGGSVSNISEWHETTDWGISMWAENPGGFAPPTYGGWYYTNNIMYIGVRKDGSYGWIEVDATDTYNPKLISYALEK